MTDEPNPQDQDDEADEVDAGTELDGTTGVADDEEED